jgi:hypothetical protein
MLTIERNRCGEDSGDLGDFWIAAGAFGNKYGKELIQHNSTY